MASYSYIVSTGTVVPDTATVQSEVEQEWIDALGLSEAPDPSSDEGRLIEAEVTSRISVARNNALLANQQNPNLSTGTFLDAHLALIGSERDAAERSTVTCTLTGVAGTLISSATAKYVEDDDRNLWQLVSDVTIGSGGSVSASFRSVEYGPINAAAGTITKIISGVVGWETVTNPDDAVPGKLQQSNVSARRQRRIELGANSRSNTYSIKAAVNALEGVAGIQILENYTDATGTFSGVSLIAHSTWICVDGGVAAEIAEAYYTSRTGGSGFNGAVTESYTDPVSGQVIPVKFDRPTDKPLICRITVRLGTSTSSITDIKNAVVDYANGEVENELGFYLGEDSSPFEVAAGVNAILPDIFVTKCELATKSAGSGSYSTDTITNAIYEKASIIVADVEVVTL